jgi:predicted nucleic-acid-binding protein
MKGVDTTIFVRFLVGDVEQQARLAYSNIFLVPRS